MGKISSYKKLYYVGFVFLLIIVSLLGYGRKRVRDQLRDDVIRVIRPVEGEIVYSIVRVSWRHL